METIRSYPISGIVSSHICWKAVEIYAHVSNKDIGKSKTPLGNLQMGAGEMIKIKRWRSSTRGVYVRTMFGYIVIWRDI